MGRWGWLTILCCWVMAGCSKKKINEEEETKILLEKFTPAMQAYFRFKGDSTIYRYDSIYNTLSTPPPYYRTLRYALLYNLNIGIKDKAIRYADSALAIFENNRLGQDYPKAYAAALLNSGNAYLDVGAYKKAIDFYFKAKKTADTYFDDCGRSDYAYNIAMVLYRQKKFDLAAANFRESYQYSVSCKDQNGFSRNRQQELQDNIALCMYNLGKYDSAMHHFNNAIVIAEQYTDPGSDQRLLEGVKGVVYGNMAKVYIKKNMPDSAIRLFKQSIALNSKPYHDQNDLQLVQAQLAAVYHQQNDLPSMKTTLEALKQGLDTLANTDATLDWNRLMYEYHRQTGKPAEALLHYQHYISAKDSLEKVKNNFSQSDINRQLMSREQELEISLLKKDNQIGKLYLWIAIALSVMAAVIIGLVYLNYRRSKKNVQVLSGLNASVNAQKLSLEKANRDKDRILHVVAHDLRSPVGMTSYAADLMLMNTEDEEQREYGNMIKQAAGQALSLINELLGVRTAADGQLPQTVQQLGTIVQTCVENARHKAAAKQQQISLHTSAHLPVNANAQRLTRLVNNLLDNAIKFSHIGGDIIVTAKAQKDTAVIRVQDNGIGIPAEKQSTIFEVFTTARQYGTAGERSHGLGLSICKQIAEEHGGTITVESRENKGTVFTVMLPLADDV
jgi:signal transduction histidine kinase